MIITKETLVTCIPNNKKYLEEKGYVWEYMKKIKIKAKDLQPSSKAEIELLCDYCLEKNIKTIIKTTYKQYTRLNINGNIQKDCCKVCISLKQKESNNKKYGVDNASKIHSLNNRHNKNNNTNEKLLKAKHIFYNKKLIPLFTYYEDNNQLLPYKCMKHNEEIQYVNIINLKSRKHSCYKCSLEAMSKFFRDDENNVFNYFKENNLIPLEDEIYVNSSTPVKCKCIYHPDFIQEIKYNNLKNQEGGCRYCIVENRKGSGNGNWKGGITNKNQAIRNSDEYSKWRNKVFKRDNYTCMCCGDDKGGNLQAHHIINFSENESLRYDIQNGITLCKKCHSPSQYESFHHTYGTKNNTKEQLEEYICNVKKELML